MIAGHNTDYIVNFYNDRVKEVIPAQDMQEPFTYVPIKAGHMELVGENAICFGKVTEGQDMVIPNVATSLSYVNISGSQARINIDIQVTPVMPIIYTYPYVPPGELPTPHDECERTVKGVLVINIPFKVYEGSVYYVTIVNAKEGINITGAYLAGVGDTKVDVRNGLAADLVSKGVPVVAGVFAWEISMYGKSKIFKQSPIFEAGDVSTIYKDFKVGIETICYVLFLGSTLKFPNLKCGAIHGYGIVYKDRMGRQCSVAKTAEMSIYIPFYTEEDDNLLESTASLSFFISHAPPVWAETYEIVYYGNMSMDWFMQVRADSITNISGDRYSINIQDTLNAIRAENGRWKVPDYVWQEGDRLRLIGTIDPATGVITKYGVGAEVIYDYEIEQTSATDYGEAIGGDFLLFQAIEHPTTFAGQNNIIVEIYVPRKGLGKTTPYGTGMVFNIGTDQYGHKYHKGDTDQVLDSAGNTISSAEVENTANDSYKFMRLNFKHGTTANQPFFAESVWPSDWWTWTLPNKLTSQGFPFLDDNSQRQVQLHERIRHGGFLIAGTRTNNIAHFTFGDYLDLPKKNGDITALREVGYVLKVLQLYKETSIYINRIQNFNADGTESFTLIDRFLGTVYPIETDMGCQNPDSVMVNGRNLYYWDNSQGKFIRSAPNGQIVLDPKVKRWYKDLLQWIRDNGGAKLLEIRTGMNIDHDEVWISFRMGNDATGMIFSEKDGRYKSRINLKTEQYIHLGAFFAHLYRQRLWIINVDEGQDYLSWVGEAVEGEIELVSNVEPNKNKIFNAIAVYSDHEWESISKSIVIPEEASAVNEIMETNVSVWDRREGIYYGEILKDQNSKGNFVSIHDKKMNGREMRGRYCFIRLKTEEHTEKVRLDSIVISSTGSERTV